MKFNNIYREEVITQLRQKIVNLLLMFDHAVILNGILNFEQMADNKNIYSAMISVRAKLENAFSLSCLKSRPYHVQSRSLRKLQ